MSLPADVHFDFAAALLLAAVVTGGVSLAYSLWRRRQPADQEAAPGRLVEFCHSFFPVILIVLLLRSFLVEPFRIPSGSMIPTLHIGDFILVNKFAYGFRMPALHFQLLPVGLPERGDVTVFRYPEDPSKDFIKRVIGLPGDDIVYANKILFINGQRMSQETTGYYTADTAGQSVIAEERREDLAGLAHDILINPNRPAREGRFVVPAGHYFVMGDNRDGSDDSRRWGMVPERHLVGKAFMIWMSWDGQRNRPALSRIGQKIR